MALREVVEIDEGLCDGCGDCVTACAEGAIRVVDGKARLVSDIYCDGLGACLGHCPQGAISVVRREAPAFDAAAVERHLAGLGSAAGAVPPAMSACPGSASRSLPTLAAVEGLRPAADVAPSALRNWPVQLHLLPPTAPFLAGADLLLAADCTAFAMGAFHARLLDGHALAVACPKLDSNQQVYLDKLVAMIDQAGIRGLTVAVMEVPCCSGLLRLAQQAVLEAERKVPIKKIVVGLRGETLAEEWV
jgi:Pyruvate/2-oxoacid:ferredoxin oxidoreductase delta subunit